MKKIEAIVNPFKFEAIKKNLAEIGIDDITTSEVKGFGREKGQSRIYRGREYTPDFVPKIKIEIVLPDNNCAEAVDAIRQSARTGETGDGIIYVVNVEKIILTRADECDKAAA